MNNKLNLFNNHEKVSSEELVPGPENISTYQYENIPKLSLKHKVVNIQGN
jgi:hypothetical protein